MKILIAVDGSPQSKTAVEKLPKFVKTATQIKLISVIERIYIVGAEPYAVSSDFYSDVEATQQKNAEEYINDAKTALAEILGNTETEILTEVFIGNPSQSIVEEAEKWQADLIVVGSHGYGFWQRTLLGSVSDAVIHHAPCSVLVVREG